MNVNLTPFAPPVGTGDPTLRIVVMEGFAQLKAASQAGEKGFYGLPGQHIPPHDVEGRLVSDFGSWDLGITWRPYKSTRDKVSYAPEYWVDGAAVEWKDVNTGTFFRKEVVRDG